MQIIQWVAALSLVALIILIPACRDSKPGADSEDSQAEADSELDRGDDAGEQIAWHRNPEEALAEAKKRGTLVVVDAYADWCGWCKKLDRDTLADATVQERLKDFTLLKLDTDVHGSFASRLGVRGLPTTLVLDANGNVVDRKVGYMTAGAYKKLIDRAAEKAR